MEALKKLHQLKEEFHIDKRTLFENYISEINLEELIFSPMNPDELKQTVKETNQVLNLDPKDFHYEKRLPKDEKYKISDFKFYFKTNQHTEELMNEISNEGYTPFDVDMVVALLDRHPEIIEFFNMTTSTIHIKEIEDYDNKPWVSAYFGKLVAGKTKWRRDKNDLDTNFIIPTYKTIEII